MLIVEKGAWATAPESTTPENSARLTEQHSLLSLSREFSGIHHKYITFRADARKQTWIKWIASIKPKFTSLVS